MCSADVIPIGQKGFYLKIRTDWSLLHLKFIQIGAHAKFEKKIGANHLERLEAHRELGKIKMYT